MIYPDIDIKENDAGVNELGKAAYFDIETGQTIVSGGKVVSCTDADNIKQWIYKTIMTTIDKYEIYDGKDYGVGVTRYIGQRVYPAGYLASELKREISEQLVKHSYIESVSNYITVVKRSVMTISFRVKLIDNSNVDVNDVTIIPTEQGAYCSSCYRNGG